MTPTRAARRDGRRQSERSGRSLAERPPAEVPPERDPGPGGSLGARRSAAIGRHQLQPVLGANDPVRRGEDVEDAGESSDPTSRRRRGKTGIKGLPLRRRRLGLVPNDHRRRPGHRAHPGRRQASRASIRSRRRNHRPHRLFGGRLHRPDAAGVDPCVQRPRDRTNGTSPRRRAHAPAPPLRGSRGGREPRGDRRWDLAARSHLSDPGVRPNHPQGLKARHVARAGLTCARGRHRPLRVRRGGSRRQRGTHAGGFRDRLRNRPRIPRRAPPKAGFRRGRRPLRRRDPPRSGAAAPAERFPTSSS